MAEIASSIFSQTDASNAGTTLPQLQGSSSSPALIDNSVQALMGAIKREHDWRNFGAGTSGGSANAQTLTYSVAPDAYYNPSRFSFIAGFSNTASMTLNVNGLGARTIKKIVGGVSMNLGDGDVRAGQYVDVVNNGTDFIMVSEPAKSEVVLVDDASVGTGTTYTINSTIINAPFSRLVAYYSNISHNSGVSQVLRLEISGDNGVGWSGAAFISPSVAAAGTVSGFVEIVSTALSTGKRIINASSTSSAAAVFITPTVVTITTGYINALRFSPGGGSFDGGTLTLIGVV